MKRRLRLDRRRFLALSAGTVAASFSSRRSTAFGADAGTADQLIAGKDKRLIVHGAEPPEIETPLELLEQHYTTPVEQLFVRNNQQPEWAATLAPPAIKDWNLDVTGLVEQPRTISLADIADLPRIDVEMVLQCSGNGRAFFNRYAPAKGAQWSTGAVGNVRFGGVALSAVFDKFGVRPQAAAKFVTAEGADTPQPPEEADFEHSLPLGDVLERSLLALDLNGKPLPAVHGGPLRLVTPGYYGTMHVKWLTKLRLETDETTNRHQVKRYRTPRKIIEPGAAFDYSLENSDANWNMRTKSMFFTPTDGARAAAGPVLLSGAAWNDGQSRIDAVEVSTDGGTWRRANLMNASNRYAWYRWQLSIDLEPGEHLLRCRAVDALGRTQPLDGSVDWNPAGYGWRGVHAVTITVA